MANCRRRFATEPEVKKHIDNHLNPHSNKGRRNTNNNNSNNLNATVLNAANLSNTIAAVASGAADLMASNKTNHSMSPRMAPIIKHELYFPQCYGPPFNQPFAGTGSGAGPPLIQENGEGNINNNNNSGESSPTGLVVTNGGGTTDATVAR